MAVPRSPSGLSPPSGERFFQKIECSTWPGDVEGQRLLQADDGPELTLVPGIGQLLQGGVGTGHVGRVVLVVVEFEDLGRVVGL